MWIRFNSAAVKSSDVPRYQGAHCAAEYEYEREADATDLFGREQHHGHGREPAYD